MIILTLNGFLIITLPSIVFKYAWYCSKTTNVVGRSDKSFVCIDTHFIIKFVIYLISPSLGIKYSVSYSITSSVSNRVFSPSTVTLFRIGSDLFRIHVYFKYVLHFFIAVNYLTLQHEYLQRFVSVYFVNTPFQYYLSSYGFNE